MNIQQIDEQRLVNIGYDPCSASCGNFMVVDQTILDKSCNIEGLKVLPLAEAFTAFPHVREKLYFNLVNKDQNEYTRMVAQAEPVGYYVRVEKGVKIEEPLQAAFLFANNGSTPLWPHRTPATRRQVHCRPRPDRRLWPD